MVEWVPERLTPAQLAERRRAAARLFRAGGVSQAEIARRLGVTRAAVSQWRAAWRRGGAARLAPRARTGRPAQLSPGQWARLARLLTRGAVAAGFDTERWTLRRVAALVAREFGVRYHPRYLARPLKAHGFTPHHPATQARERDEYVIARWPTRDWVALKKKRGAKAGPSSWSTRPATPSARAPGPRGRGAARRRSSGA